MGTWKMNSRILFKKMKLSSMRPEVEVCTLFNIFDEISSCFRCQVIFLKSRAYYFVLILEHVAEDGQLIST
jgi:hypothetical protein